MPPKSSTKPKSATVTANKPGTPTQKKKHAAKKQLSTEERLKRLFTSLCAQIDGGHFTNAAKTCDKILRLEPTDEDALQTKLFLLLQTEQYTAAISLLGSSKLKSGGPFERAYCLYRLQHEPEAAELLQGIKEAKAGNDDDRGVLHLEAQLNYRQGAYQDAFDLYNQLLDTTEPHTEEHSDILTNLQASQKHLDFINTDYHRALDQLPTSLTNALETAPPPVQSTSSLAASIGAFASSAAASQGDVEVTRPTVPKKTRARRVPKGVVPGVTPPPDPERWVKKSERSTFMQARGKRKGGGGATQGVVEGGGGGAASGQSRSGGGHGKAKKKK
ncbi:hypothetical protein DENSPDRAFT_836287 [Dentipellis sp. KUC8613]|nr:hypothetical protein DENSPDRAFT_836287 [Dentipellis sp. KUC8613]